MKNSTVRLTNSPAANSAEINIKRIDLVNSLENLNLVAPKTQQQDVSLVGIVHKIGE